MAVDRSIVENWLQRKLDREHFHPSHAKTVSRTWEKITGGRRLFGQVTIRVVAAKQFQFTDKVAWPDQPEIFSAAVLDGILDALMVDRGNAPGAHFTLESAEWKGHDSVPYAYQQAAREAGHAV